MISGEGREHQLEQIARAGASAGVASTTPPPGPGKVVPLPAQDKNYLGASPEARGEFADGLYHLAVSSLASALAAFRRCVELAPEWGEAWYRLGEAEARCRHPRAAMEAFQQASRCWDGRREPFWALAAFAVARRQFAEALRLFGATEQSVRAMPPRAAVAFAEAVSRGGRHDTGELFLARVALETATAHGCKKITVLLLLARICGLLRDEAAALKWLRESVALYPFTPVSWDALIIFMRARNRHLEVAEAVRLKFDLWEESLDAAMVSAQGLQAMGRYDDAIDLLLRLAEQYAEDPRIAVRLGIALRLGNRLQEAISWLRRGAERPGHHGIHAKLALAEIYLQVQRADLVLSILEPLRKQFPDNARVALVLAQAQGQLGLREAALKSLEGSVPPVPADMKAAVAAAGDEVLIEHSGEEGRKAAIPQGNPGLFALSWDGREPPRRGFAVALMTHLSVVSALLMREMRTRFGRNKLGYFWAIFDPVIQLATFWSIFTITGMKSIAGLPIPLFLLTGILPWVAFNNTYTRLCSATRQNDVLMSFPQVTRFDIQLSRGILEFLTYGVVGVVLIFALATYGIEVNCFEFEIILAAYLSTWAIGYGLGTLVGIAASFAPSVESVMAALLRLLYFFSGIMFSVSHLPYRVREVLLWNPLLHTIEIIRTHFGSTNAVHHVSLSYAGIVALALVFTGLILDRAVRMREN